MKEHMPRNKVKIGLLALGILLIVGGLACTIIGSVSFFATLGTGKLPILFILLIFGLPMLTIGVAILMIGARKAPATVQPTPVAEKVGEEDVANAQFSDEYISEDDPLLLPPAPTRATLRCDKCGAENDASLSFCETCGAALPKHCPHCGKEVRPAATYCGGCGTKL